eukprot:scaffold6563_cov70-Phaeocystis_antarctica.AAC.2
MQMVARLSERSHDYTRLPVKGTKDKVSTRNLDRILPLHGGGRPSGSPTPSACRPISSVRGAQADVHHPRSLVRVLLPRRDWPSFYQLPHRIPLVLPQHPGQACLPTTGRSRVVRRAATTSAASPSPQPRMARRGPSCAMACTDYP